jgi:SAM-dependent methyltransferase
MTDAETSPVNADQIEFWNSPAGEKWVTHQDALDRFMTNIKARLLERAAVRPGEHVLDIGCGAGETTMELASRVGPEGRVAGVDVSRLLLAKAEARAAAAGIGHLAFTLADAQTHEFVPGEFDLVASRFGVMFFADPVAAFRNIATALKPGGRMVFVAWGTLEKNPWFTIPRDAAVAQLGAPTPVPANAPGPFAFQDPTYVIDILSEAGLAEPSVSVEEIMLTPAGDLETIATLAATLGPASRIIGEKDGTPDDVAAIVAKIAEALAVYGADGAYPVPATVNFFAAKAPAPRGR